MAQSQGTAVFAVADTASLTFSPALTSNPPTVVGSGLTVTDSKGSVSVFYTNLTNTGCTINASAPFSGSFTLVVKD